MLKQRIQILQMGGAIGEDAAEFTYRVIDLIGEDYPKIGMDAAAMFTTHLAMAVERILQGNVVEAMDPELFSQVEDCSQYAQAADLRDKMLSFCPVVFPESERQYLTMHICNMLQEVPDGC